MLVVDVEATGTNPHKHAMLSVGAVPLGESGERFYEECRAFTGAHIDDEALKINGFTRAQALDPAKQTDESLVKKFLAWAARFEDRTIAGQNPSFDRDFLQAAAERYHLNWPLAYRTIDVHSVAYTHFVLRGKRVPHAKHRSALDLDATLRYVGLPDEPTPHHALTGALLEAEALSRLLHDAPLLPEYARYPLPWGESRA